MYEYWRVQVCLWQSLMSEDIVIVIAAQEPFLFFVIADKKLKKCLVNLFINDTISFIIKLIIVKHDSAFWSDCKWLDAVNIFGEYYVNHNYNFRYISLFEQAASNQCLYRSSDHRSRLWLLCQPLDGCVWHCIHFLHAR